MPAGYNPWDYRGDNDPLRQPFGMRPLYLSQQPNYFRPQPQHQAPEPPHVIRHPRPCRNIRPADPQPRPQIVRANGPHDDAVFAISGCRLKKWHATLGKVESLRAAMDKVTVLTGQKAVKDAYMAEMKKGLSSMESRRN